MSINNPRTNPNFALNQITLRVVSYLLLLPIRNSCTLVASGEDVSRDKRGRRRLLPYFVMSLLQSRWLR